MRKRNIVIQSRSKSCYNQAIIIALTCANIKTHRSTSFISSKIFVLAMYGDESRLTGVFEKRMLEKCSLLYI